MARDLPSAGLKVPGGVVGCWPMVRPLLLGSQGLQQTGTTGEQAPYRGTVDQSLRSRLGLLQVG